MKAPYCLIHFSRSCSGSRWLKLANSFRIRQECLDLLRQESFSLNLCVFLFSALMKRSTWVIHFTVSHGFHSINAPCPSTKMYRAISYISSKTWSYLSKIWLILRCVGIGRKYDIMKVFWFKITTKLKGYLFVSRNRNQTPRLSNWKVSTWVEHKSKIYVQPND